jgi:hypothetical protein
MFEAAARVLQHHAAELARRTGQAGNPNAESTRPDASR